MTAAGMAFLPDGLDIPDQPEMPGAACLGLPDIEIMHPAVGNGKPGKPYAAAVARAVAICDDCPIATRRRCLADAYAWPGDVSGVWGGIPEHVINEQKRAARKRRPRRRTVTAVPTP